MLSARAQAHDRPQRIGGDAGMGASGVLIALIVLVIGLGLSVPLIMAPFGWLVKVQEPVFTVSLRNDYCTLTR